MRCSKDKGSPPFSSRAMLQLMRAHSCSTGNVSSLHTHEVTLVACSWPQWEDLHPRKQQMPQSRPTLPFRPTLPLGEAITNMYSTCFLAVDSTDPALSPGLVSCRNSIKNLFPERHCQQGPGTWGCLFQTLGPLGPPRIRNIPAS